MQKSKKKSTTSKRGRPRGRTIKVDISDNCDDDAKLTVHNELKKDPEANVEMPKDEASKHKFPPPRVHPRFREVWMQFIDDISGRTNFKNGHLNALEVLCDLFVEYDDLRAFVRTQGRTYKSLGRNGAQYKFYPEVDHLHRVQAQIKEYMKMLGLLLKKDKSSDNPEGEKGEWD